MHTEKVTVPHNIQKRLNANLKSISKMYNKGLFFNITVWWCKSIYVSVSASVFVYVGA